jgi:hypothetical protein
MHSVNRLIPFPVIIGRLSADVGGKRNPSDRGQDAIPFPFIFHPDDFPGAQIFHDIPRAGAIENDPGTGPDLPAYHGLPQVRTPLFQQEDFHGPAGRILSSQEPGRNHTGVVQNQKIGGIQNLREVEKIPVLHPPGVPVKDHQSGTVSFFRGDLGDQAGIQSIVKLGEPHHSLISTRSVPG